MQIEWEEYANILNPYSYACFKLFVIKVLCKTESKKSLDMLPLLIHVVFPLVIDWQPY